MPISNLISSSTIRNRKYKQPWRAYIQQWQQDTIYNFSDFCETSDSRNDFARRWFHIEFLTWLTVISPD